ncbi:CopD family protein [Massilia glaciei]|uniref:Protoporphyrinogen IX oxidase n=1 Tax=Massilia glaciei TaxID=1524097 RepID=A0A2U2HNU6_9BURK|nr:CopD family protein [Massilia glaciei]PWF49085.1 hypothetical protein C7C56_008465 [Massilia glaciei]
MSLMLSLHIVFVVIWSATLLYFPQLLAQHAGAGDPATRRASIHMQHGLYVFAMTPGGVLTVLAGVWLLFERGFAGGWLPVKLFAVLLMVFLHLYFGKLMRDLHQRKARPAPRFYRALSLGPAILIFVVLGLVLAKPF